MHQSRIRTFIETEFEAGGHTAKGRITNVSESGAFVGTASIPELGDGVQLRFREPGGDEVRFSGLVWWTTNDSDGKQHRIPGFGLRMVDDNEGFDRFFASLQSAITVKRRRS